MKNIYLLLIALLIGNLTFGQTLIVGQNFDDVTTWAYTADPAEYILDSGKDIWGITPSLNSGGIVPQDGTNFWGMRDLDNPWINNATDDPLAPGLGLTSPYAHSLIFENASVTGKTGVSVSFYYSTESLAAEGYIAAEFFFDDASQGVDTVFSGYSDGATTSGWLKFTKDVPDGTNNVKFTIRGYNNQDLAGVDNVKLESTGGLPVCTLSLGANTAVCDAVTAGTDTYTATLAFTGAGTETFTVTPSSGAVSGDDPTSVVDGTITVTGVDEGVDLTITVTSALCNESAVITAPTCVPAPTLPSLPITDHFDYAIGTDLTLNDMWTSSDSGDSIYVESGSLSYAGLEASTGNSVFLSGLGMEAELDFEPVTTGKVFTSFIFKVTDMTNWTTGGYFAYLGGFNSRLNIQPIGNQFGIGVAKKNSLTTVIWMLNGADSVKFDLNTDIFVVMNYDVEAGTSDVWVNPAPADLGAETAPAADVTLPDGVIGSIGKFALRQDSDTETPGVLVDELRIGVSWASVTPKGASNSVSTLNTSNFSIYPNPVSDGYFSIQTKNNSVKNVRIYNLIGKQVFSKQVIGNQKIDVSSLKSGFYFVSFEQEGLTSTGKIIIE